MQKLKNAMIVLGASFGALATSQAQEVLFDSNGTQGAQRYGSAFVFLQDVSGDGEMDMAIGSPYSDFSAGDSGRVEIIDGVTQSVLFNIDGFAAGQLIGHSLDQLGDINGDSFPDLLVGAPGGDGLAIIYNGISGAILRTHQGTSGEQRGFCVKALDDIDGDSVRDYAVGSPKANAMGQVDIYSGQTGMVIQSIVGTHANGDFGYSLSAMADSDGDSIADLLIGEPKSSVAVTDGGSVYIYSSVSGQILRQVDGSFVSGYLGYSVVGLPDITGDGLEEFAAGAPNAFLLDSANGVVTVFHGNPSLPPVYSFQGTYQGAYYGEQLGSSLVTLDFNRDGFLDLACGAPNALCGISLGAVWIFSLKSGCLLYQVTETAVDSDRFGEILGGGADFNGDGFDDLMIGDPRMDIGVNDRGRALIVTGDEFHLNICPKRFNSGTPVNINIAERPFLTPYLLVVMNVNGMPVFNPIIGGTFPGTQCVEILNVSTVGFPSGIELTIRPYTLDNNGQAFRGNDEVIRSN